VQCACIDGQYSSIVGSGSPARDRQAPADRRLRDVQAPSPGTDFPAPGQSTFG